MIAQARSSQRPSPVLDDGLSAVRARGRLLVGAPPSPGLIWQALLALARGHGLSPLLDFRLFERSSIAAGEEEGARVPEEVAKLLREAIAEAKPVGLCGAKLAGGSLCAA